MDWRQFFSEHSGVICENTSEERELLTEIFGQGMTIDFDEIDEDFVMDVVNGALLAEGFCYPITYGLNAGMLFSCVPNKSCIPFRDALAADRHDAVFVEDLI